MFFSEIGRRMGITGMPEELQDLIDWAEVRLLARSSLLLEANARTIFLQAYEVENMVPDTGCRDIAEATILLLLHNVPSFLHPIGRNIVSSLLTPRLRAAVMCVSASHFSNFTNPPRRTGSPTLLPSSSPPSKQHSTFAPSSSATSSFLAPRRNS